MLSRLIAVTALVLSASVAAQTPLPATPQPMATFAFEDKDWGIEPISTPKKSAYHAPTPTTIPGARVIKTLELKALLAANKEVLVIDVLDGQSRKTIPGAHWMPGVGSGQFYRADKIKFATTLDRLSGGNKARPLVFLCVGAECWLSYNSALHALEAGYTDVLWYRGGTNSWTGASQPSRPPERAAEW